MKIITMFMNMLYFVNGNVEDVISSISKGIRAVTKNNDSVPDENTTRLSVL